MKKSDYELTTANKTTISATAKDLEKIAKKLESFAKTILSTYQIRRGQGVIKAMRFVVDAQNALREVPEILEDWEESIFDPFTGRKTKPKPKRPKTPKYE